MGSGELFHPKWQIRNKFPDSDPTLKHSRVKKDKTLLSMDLIEL